MRRKIAADCTAAERVAQGLAEDIGSGKILPGTRLDEAAIAKRFGVSRTPVREALRHVAAAGLAERRAHCGVFVRAEPGESELAELEKALLELHLACARQAGAEPLVLPSSLCDSLRRVREGAGNRYLIEAAEGVWRRAKRYLEGAAAPFEPMPLSGAAQAEEEVRNRLDLAWAAARAMRGQPSPTEPPQRRQPRRTLRPRSS